MYNSTIKLFSQFVEEFKKKVIIYDNSNYMFVKKIREYLISILLRKYKIFFYRIFTYV